MNNLIKGLTIIFVMNIFMYLGVNFSISAEDGNTLNKDYKFHFENDLMDSFLSSNVDLDQIAQDTKENWTNYGIEFNGTFTGLPQKEAGQDIGVGGITFLDSLNIVWPFLATLGNLIIAPLTLFFNFRMPVFIGIMIGLPYFLMLVLSIFAFIRGVPD